MSMLRTAWFKMTASPQSLAKRLIDEMSLAKPNNQKCLDMISAGADMGGNKSGDTPLHFVANVTLLNAMLATGRADINARNGEGKTPLAYRKFGPRNRDMVFAMINAGADVNVTLDRREKTTPLMQACGHDGDIEIARALLSAKADVLARDAKGDTALHHVVFSKDPAIIADLVKAGADINASNDFYFYDHDIEHTVHTVLHRIPATIASSQGWTPLMLATCYGRDDIVTALLKEGAETEIPGKKISADDIANATPADRYPKHQAMQKIKQLLQNAPSAVKRARAKERVEKERLDAVSEAFMRGIKEAITSAPIPTIKKRPLGQGGTAP